MNIYEFLSKDSKDIYLDDILFEYAIKFNLTRIEYLQELINGLYKICDIYLNTLLIYENKNFYKKLVIDKTFNGWEIFIERLSESDYFLWEIISLFPFKKFILDNNFIVKKIYTTK